MRETLVFSARVVPASHTLHAGLNMTAALFINFPDRCSNYIRSSSRTVVASLSLGVGRVIGVSELLVG